MPAYEQWLNQNKCDGSCELMCVWRLTATTQVVGWHSVSSWNHPCRAQITPTNTSVWQIITIVVWFYHVNMFCPPSPSPDIPKSHMAPQHWHGLFRYLEAARFEHGGLHFACHILCVTIYVSHIMRLTMQLVRDKRLQGPRQHCGSELKSFPRLKHTLQHWCCCVWALLTWVSKCYWAAPFGFNLSATASNVVIE